METKMKDTLSNIQRKIEDHTAALWEGNVKGILRSMELISQELKALLPAAQAADEDKAILNHLDQNFFHTELDDWDIKMNALQGKSMKFSTYVPHRVGGGTARSRIMEQIVLLSAESDTHVPLFAREIVPEPRTEGEAVFDYTAPKLKVSEPPRHVRTNTEHVYLNQATGKYTYSDETMNFADAEYDSEEQAKRALQAYACFTLDNPMTDRERCIEVEHYIQCVIDRAPADSELGMYARRAAWEIGKLSVQLHAKESQLTYLAAPYTGTTEQVEARMQMFYRLMAKLDYHGMYTCSPLLKHAILTAGDAELPGDWEYWQHYSRIMLNQCSQLVVVCLQGWRESVGVQGEIDHARKIGVPIMYVDEYGNQITPATVV